MMADEGKRNPEDLAAQAGTGDEDATQESEPLSLQDLIKRKSLGEQEVLLARLAETASGHPMDDDDDEPNGAAPPQRASASDGPVQPTEEGIVAVESGGRPVEAEPAEEDTAADPREQAAAVTEAERAREAEAFVANALGSVEGGGRAGLSQAVLILNTFLLAVVAGGLVYVLAHPSETPNGVSAALAAMAMLDKTRQGDQAANSPSRPGQAPPTMPADANAKAPDANSAVVDAVTAPSLAAAESAYANKDFDRALDRYSRLVLASRRLPSEALPADFYQYRITACMRQLGQADRAGKILLRLATSDSPAVRAAANADLAAVDEAEGHPLQARMLAYRAIAALAAMDTPLPLEADCDYLASRALTGKVNLFYTTEQTIPWSRLKLTDPFAGRPESEVRRLLDEGASASTGSGQVPEIRIAQAGQRWTVTSVKASLADVLHQFAARTGKDVQWLSVPPAVRRRVVSFHFREAPEQRICEVACGMAGLAARFTWDQIVVHDPQSIETLLAQKDLLTREAVSAWRRFSLRFSEDRRTAEGQFALAALYEWSGDTVGAMRQYQLVARQHQRETEVAPRAMMRCAELRMGLRDYAGARSDLLDLLDLFPAYPRLDEVQMALGRVNVQAGQLDEAVRIFLKLYHLNTSTASRQAACLGAGECYCRMGRHEEASRWLSRYLVAGKSASGSDVVRAYLLLGRSEEARGNSVAACEALRRALSARPDREQYVEAILALARVKKGMDDYVGALGTIRRIDKEQLTTAQTCEQLLLLSSIYRSMGLPDVARSELRQRAALLSDSEARAQIAVEQARCLWETGDLQGARQGISEVLGKLKAGLPGWQAALDLGEIALAMDDGEQAIIVAREVASSHCPEAVRRRALEILGRAYLRTGDYAKATEALSALGQAAAPPQTPKGKVQ